MAFFTPVLETVTRIMITRMMILEWCSEDSRIPRRYLGTCYELSNWSPGLSSPSINHSIDIFFFVSSTWATFPTSICMASSCSLFRLWEAFLRLELRG